MRANDFVNRLSELIPEKDVLLNLGYSEEEADGFVNSFICLPRKKPLNFNSSGDPMLDLVCKWELSNVVVGPICFYQTPQKGDELLVFGDIEADKIACRLGANDYVLLNQELSISDRRQPMCDVAYCGKAFLEGLLLLAEYYTKTGTEELTLDDRIARELFKSECIKTLGGPKYESFCTIIFGE